ncbi:MAG: malonyl-[acyl-carrier protein] O-methyltransferase BioC [Legionellales bacterium]|nr:malonyl-[acyl-carrier protein] O-methyltransferase BioC [Legionellales bacterium]
MIPCIETVMQCEGRCLMSDPVVRSFEAAADQYDQFAFIQAEIRARLIERLGYLSNIPEYVQDLGCGTGHLLQQLQLHWPSAQLIGLDAAYAMCQKAHTVGGPLLVCADARSLPWQDRCIDLTVSNCLMQWFWDDLPEVLQEVFRTLKPGGGLFFTTLGPDTLQEVRAAWAEVDSFDHVNQFLDMHHVGDIVRDVGFEDVVMDRWSVTLDMPSVDQVLKDVKGIGAGVVKGSNRPRGLMGPDRLKRFKSAYEAAFILPDGGVQVTYEVIFAQAWRPMKASNEVGLDAIDRPSRSSD